MHISPLGMASLSIPFRSYAANMEHGTCKCIVDTQFRRVARLKWTRESALLWWNWPRMMVRNISRTMTSFLEKERGLIRKRWLKQKQRERERESGEISLMKCLFWNSKRADHYLMIGLYVYIGPYRILRLLKVSRNPAGAISNEKGWRNRIWTSTLSLGKIKIKIKDEELYFLFLFNLIATLEWLESRMRKKIYMYLL